MTPAWPTALTHDGRLDYAAARVRAAHDELIAAGAVLVAYPASDAPLPDADLADALVGVGVLAKHLAQDLATRRALVLATAPPTTGEDGQP